MPKTIEGDKESSLLLLLCMRRAEVTDRIYNRLGVVRLRNCIGRLKFLSFLVGSVVTISEEDKVLDLFAHDSNLFVF